MSGAEVGGAPREPMSRERLEEIERELEEAKPREGGEDVCQWLRRLHGIVKFATVTGPELTAEVRRLTARVHVEEMKVRGDLKAIDDLLEHVEIAERERDEARAEVARLSEESRANETWRGIVEVAWWQLREALGCAKGECMKEKALALKAALAAARALCGEAAVYLDTHVRGLKAWKESGPLVAGLRKAAKGGTT